MTKLDKLSTSILFHIGWLGCVLLANSAFELLVFIFPFFMICFLHWKKQLLFRHYPRLILLLIAGLLFDAACIKLGFVKLIQSEFAGLLPIWLTSLWVLFVFSLPFYKQLLPDNLFSIGLFGAIVGPLSYKSGEALDVLVMPDTISVIVYSLFWAAYFPLSLQFINFKEAEL